MKSQNTLAHTFVLSARALMLSAVAALMIVAALATGASAVPISTGLSLQYDGTDVTTSGIEVLSWNNQGSLAAEGHVTPKSAAARPTLSIGSLNGHNVINYAGQANEVLRSGAFTTPITQANTLLMVMQDTGTNDPILFDGADAILPVNRNFFRPQPNSSDYQLYAGNSRFSGTGVLRNQYMIYTTRFDEANTTVHANGALDYSGQPTIGTQSLSSASIGNSDELGAPLLYALTGQIAEVLFYDTALTTTQRAVTENYLSAKYNVGSTTAGSNITLGANDLYAGDLDSNGDYDDDVFGIGNDGTSTLTMGDSAALSLAESGSTMGIGEFLLAGHDGTAHGLTPAEGLSSDRWARIYYLDMTGDLDATLAFDYAEAGLTTPSGSDLFSLLYSPAGGPLSWETVGIGGLSGDEVQFLISGAQFDDGLYTLSVVPVPEPSSFLLLGLGALGLVRHTRRRRRRV